MNLITTYPRHFCDSQCNPISFIQTDLSTSMACLRACPLGLNPRPFEYVLGMLTHLSEAAKCPCACMLVPGLCASSTSMSEMNVPINAVPWSYSPIVQAQFWPIMLVVVGQSPRRCTSRNFPFIPWSCHLIPSKISPWTCKSLSC